MTKITTSITSFRAPSHLDPRTPGRYRTLNAHHTRIRHAASLHSDRAALAADVTQLRQRPTPTPIKENRS